MEKLVRRDQPLAQHNNLKLQIVETAMIRPVDLTQENRAISRTPDLVECHMVCVLVWGARQNELALA